jgi:hypothetical protein
MNTSATAAVELDDKSMKACATAGKAKPKTAGNQIELE